MNKTVYIASSPMGSGKTKGMLEGFEPEKNYLVAVPKIDLIESIVTRVEKTDMSVQAIHSDDGEYGPVKDRVEVALNEGREGSVVIITQTTLLNIDTAYLGNWTVVIDEVPDINNCKSKRIGYNNFKDLFGKYVTVDEEFNCSIDAFDLMEITERYTEARRTDQTEVVLMYGGILNDSSEVQLEDHDGTWLIKHHGYMDYSNIIEDSEEFHIMGNGVEKTLFYLWLKAKGYKLEDSPFKPVFNGYDMPPELVILVSGNKFSKEMMLSRADGTKADKIEEGCFGWDLLEKAVNYHSGEDVIVQVFKWMKEAFPFEQYKNVEVTDFDVRGLNDYSSYHRTVNLVHGNPTPIQGRMEYRMFEMMGVDPKEAEKAVRYERHIGMMSQHILRTDQRNIGKQKKQVISVVPTEDVALQIQEDLQIECKINKSIMVDPPKSKAKSSREELKAKAKKLSEKGWSYQKIADEIGKNKGTISRWLKAA